MFTAIYFTLFLLVLSTIFIYKKFPMHKNITVLFFAQPLVMAGSPVIVFIGGILSNKIAKDPSLATLPVTLMILGVASTSIPAALLAKKKGRKFAAITGFTFAFIASILATIAALIANFELFSISSLVFGISTAFVQQLRFAAIESVNNKNDVPKVLSLLMLSGLFAAFLGPETAVAAQHLIASPHGFAGSFLILALYIVIALIAISFYQNVEISTDEKTGAERPIFDIIRQPVFIIAILSGAIGYALMSYLMTATPMSMHEMHGHSLQDTKWVIQSHIAAMFLPSLFTGWLVGKFGLKFLLLTGTVMYTAVVVVALSGHQVMHYWWALILLGVGWNFLFLTGTSLLPLSYNNVERHKVQALNDFILFGFQAVASLLAGWVLFKAGWHTVVLSSMPFILILFAVNIYFYRLQKCK